MNVFTMKASRMLRDCLAVACMIFTVVSCTRDEYSDGTVPVYAGEPVEVNLALKVSSVQVVGATMNGDGSASAPVTRTVADPEGLERQVSDIWVFQFSEDGSRQVGAPRYYTVQTQGGAVQPVKLMLRACENSQIYVVANTHDAAWGKGKESLNVTRLGNQTLSFTSEEDVYGNGQGLPMAALVTGQTIKTGEPGGTLDIVLKSLVAKIQFRYTLASVVQDRLHVTGVRLYNIPDRVRLGNAVTGTTGVYPAEGEFTSIDGEDTYPAAVQPVAGEVYTWYIPQNLQGSVGNDDPKQKNEYAPAHAFHMRVWVDSELDGASYAYTVYPGANTYNDFNVRNGNLYNVTVTFNTGITDDRVTADPANCFVMRRNSQIQFDPYTRTETGGGFKYSDYVDANHPDKSFERVDILWQTGDGTDFAIGNNTNGNLVYYDKAKQRVHVSSGNADGNAVIAGYNAKGVIVWSWHIWVNENRPAQLANAQEYYTYRWDSNGIYYNEPRVKGHSFMVCNLGATGTLDELKGITKGSIKPYGVYYQWGRKDPFPPTAREELKTFAQYTYPDVVNVYGNDAKLLPMNTTAGETGSFQAIKIDASTGNIDYSIKHPMTFMGTADIGSFFDIGAESPTHNLDLYVNDGDWYWGHNDRLWGGVPFAEADVNYNDIVANNGAEHKSIFDPCPAGWILPKSDAWMGFTIDGLNQSADNVSKQNNRNPATVRTDKGMEIYLEDWHSGPVAWFPIPGWRTADGSQFVVGACGGYYTSAASFNYATSILHFHNNLLNPYDYKYQYSRRANAYPVRCVREE